MNFSRRAFLTTTCGAAFLLPGLASAQNQERLTDDPLAAAAARPVLNLEGLRDPIVIESIDLFRRGRDYLIRVRSRDGAEGVSVDNGRAEMLRPILQKAVIPYFLGKDARYLEELLWGVYRQGDNYKLQGLAFWCPVAWVEFAILDMLGRVAGRSLGNLLGGVVRKRVPFYIASGRRDTTPEEEIDYLKGLLEESGARAVKYRVGGRMSRNEDASPGRTERLIPLSRQALGGAIAIHADSNSSYDPKHAIAVGRMLEEIKAVYFEEPCPFDHLEETRKVTEALTIPVAGGEQEYSEWRFKWAIQNRVTDIVQPDLQYYGGLIRSTRVARMAEVKRMPTTVHISGGFGFVYMLHFASCTPRIGDWQEYKKGIAEYGPLFDPPLRIEEGALTVPDGPGVGLADPAALLREAEPVSG